MTRHPIFNPKTGEVLSGTAFDSPAGRFAVHECANECQGIIVGVSSKTGTAVIHYAPQEAMEIAQALLELAKKALG